MIDPVNVGPNDYHLHIARENYILCSILLAIWIFLLVRTCLKTANRLLYSIIICFMIQNALYIVYYVINDRIRYVRPIPNPDLLADIEMVINPISLICFYMGHWLFCWKYWPVAQMVSKMSPSNESDNRCSKVLLIVNSVLIVVTCTFWGVLDASIDKKGRRE
jgi:hypothetical protein